MLKQGGKAMKETQTTHLHQPNKQTTELRKVKTSQVVVGMTYGACQGPGYMSAGVLGVSTALR
jgi:hypothetical protein